jgi:hypothetical protein
MLENEKVVNDQNLPGHVPARNYPGNSVFAPGSRHSNRGRKPGVQNKLTIIMKEALAGSAEKMGEMTWNKKKKCWENGPNGWEGFFCWLCKNHTDKYVDLLGKLMPQMIDANVTTDDPDMKNYRRTVVEAAQELNARGAPTPALELLLPDADNVVRFNREGEAE